MIYYNTTAIYVVFVHYKLQKSTSTKTILVAISLYYRSQYIISILYILCFHEYFHTLYPLSFALLISPSSTLYVFLNPLKRRYSFTNFSSAAILCWDNKAEYPGNQLNLHHTYHFPTTFCLDKTYLEVQNTTKFTCIVQTVLKIGKGLRANY